MAEEFVKTGLMDGMGENDEIERWITVKGNHIPIKKGQSPKHAIEQAFGEKKQPRMKKSTSVMNGLGESDSGNEETTYTSIDGIKRKIAEKEKYSEQGEDFIALLKLNCDSVKVNRLKDSLQEKEIIEKVGGNDTTDGSCVSLALSYIANLCGYDVTDLRGGKSQIIFASSYYSQDFWDIPELQTERQFSQNGFDVFDKLSAKFDNGEKYIMCIGKHCAIVKKEKEELAYLELQSISDNGWHVLDKGALVDRFGVEENIKSKDSDIFIQTGFYSNVKQFQNCAEFGEVLEYINTSDNSVGKEEN